MPSYKALLTLLIVLLGSQLTIASPLLWPQPQSLKFNSSALPLHISPCEIRYIIQSPLQPYIQNIIDFYLSKVFTCSSPIQNNYTLVIGVPSPSINLPLETKQEAYTLIIRQSVKWELTAQYYTGFIRGFQTFSQLFSEVNGGFSIQGIPITIDDQPNFKWRGLMIDSSRHFLPVSYIKKTIDALMFNKMNILHWHVIDQDSFPLFIPSIPELSRDGSIAGNYSMQDVEQITSYAKIRGVRVVVQIDTPAHTHSWGRTHAFKDVVIRCNNVYTGQFDPTLKLTYDLVWHVMNYADEMFEDPYIHFGGDETSNSCWDLQPQIKEWMKENNITDYKALSSYYRQRQKSLWRNISSTKKSIYWANQAIDLPLEQDDVVQWWGLTSNLSRLVGRPNQVILSNYDQTYLDVGFGNRNGLNYRTYITWRQIYKFSARHEGVNVIGGQTCMWSELSNVHTHQQKIWIRTSVLAERLWNDKIDIQSELAQIGARLVVQMKRMKKRGYKTSPVTVGICENDLGICF